MNRRTRTLLRHSPTRTEPFLKYLKPGALARLRDSRINARSLRFVSLPQISPRRAPSPPLSPSDYGQPQVNMIDDFPCFVGRIYGPRFPQRKKLVAAKAMLFLSSSTSGPVPSPPDPLIDVINSDILLAH